ncbi:AAA family ATPase [Microvirga arsenatis]|uniref:AAA family ATPase n=1 Tax=Microvirga arsenatis TaxID=2692265 RepID=A0ABW9YUJ0_9HYPH|nr:AAA family ATPase [Microvirga arsenatis]NBJ09347.1 AAA family ATPase [Microvirga arsenatis]NBJ23795.1 AAA family ATPase [Microvirga arsenatis]
MDRYISEVLLRHYKSIGRCRVKLGSLSILVGPNGAGKSNFIDAIKFTSEALSQGLDYAIRQRGGIDGVRRRSTGHPTHFGIRLNIRLSDKASAYFAFEIGAQPNGAYVVQREVASISSDGIEPAHYEIKRGETVKFSGSVQAFPKITSDRLMLVSLSGLEEFRDLYDFLTRMAFYNINPADIRAPQPHEAGDILSHTGRNISSVIRQMKESAPQSVERVEAYLRSINPMIEGVDNRSFGPQETLEFRQKVQNSAHPWRFLAHSMSDGTLRSIGLLTALFQNSRVYGPPSLVSIEEPEMTIHPGAAGIVMDALFEASRSQQVIATTHSPDLLDHENLKIDDVRVVRNIDGETFVSNADKSSVDAIKQQLYTAGDLLRNRQLEPDLTNIKPITQLELFAHS